MGNISAPVFGAATPEQFLGRPQSLQPDPTAKAADPAKVKAFADANPEVLLQGRYYASQPVPASFGSVFNLQLAQPGDRIDSAGARRTLRHRAGPSSGRRAQAVTQP